MVQTVATPNPWGLPAVFIDKALELPSVPAVYFVLWNKAVLYVGATKDLKRRFRNHHRGDMFSVFEFVKVAWWEQPSSADLEALAGIEKQAIADVCPLFNDRKDETQTNVCAYEWVCIQVSDIHLPYIAQLAKDSGRSTNGVLSELFSDCLNWLRFPEKRPKGLWDDEDCY